MTGKRMLLAAVLSAFGHSSRILFAQQPEVVTFYPTYGYDSGGNWIIPVRMWVHERRPVAEQAVAGLLTRLHEDLTPDELVIFRSRAIDFLADSESRERVTLMLRDDPRQEILQLIGGDGQPLLSDRNGLIEGTLTLSRARADEVAAAQKSEQGWLTVDVTSSGHEGSGRIQLIGPEGVSVISDVDDTIKITEIPEGTATVVRNTLFREFRAAPELVPHFRALEPAPVHYVSGGPWQLYEPVSLALIAGGNQAVSAEPQAAGAGAGAGAGAVSIRFPEGTFHMLNVRKNLTTAATWDDLRTLLLNDNRTMDHKLAIIRRILGHFPRRRFVLIGDSGERDPEIYQAIREEFPAQVQEIIIRDVVGPKRFRNMLVIPAASDSGSASGSTPD